MIKCRVQDCPKDLEICCRECKYYPECRSNCEDIPANCGESVIDGVETPAPTIKDSGNRTQFNTGAVRDMHHGKGRMDLLPWKGIIKLSKHCENGAEKYGEHNVDKGILLHSLIDSGARHLGLFISGEADEDHLVAAAWNIMWALQFRETMPELNDLYYWKGEDQCSDVDAIIAE